MCTVMSRRTQKILASVGTLSAITIPAVLFLSCQLRYIVDKLSYGPPTVILSVYAALVVEFLFVSTSNPGFLDKKLFPGHAFNHLTGSYRRVAPQRFLEVPINGQIVRAKYCVTCHIYRPPRTVHCSSCGGCVLRYDHHCPYVGNCIGFNNYRKFSLFVVTCCLYYFLIFASGIYHFIGFFPELWLSFEAHPATSACTVISIVISLLVLWLVTGLCCFHVVVVVKGQSTYDRIKGNYPGFNPFYRGCRMSMRDLLCTKSRISTFGNPCSPSYSVKTLFQPGAMFTSQEQQEEFRRQNESFHDSHNPDVLNTHEKNTLKYIKTFGQTDQSSVFPLSQDHTAYSSHGEELRLFSETSR
ncbi:Palmitoyltransferase ZDHHC9 [Babesia sp. Xinjiang]|uniref:Palmitoyltransferase ZDHHC9 n=1 Tax=Babesia sp. Xinjiang TaxID=462227 RepID=UPI000A25C322|nr:Palmitoyltransferase ZDHHC9 [Babesia sp. Xinjiang]ORM41126.1 Palmitoyltransferase ZDHHC9 [Babesia sp. Xinjiang]